MKALAHLKKLSSVKSNSGVKFLTPAAFPGNHCPLHTALALSSDIKGMSTLVVGTAECGTYSRNVIYKSKHKDSALHYMYILDAHEVVFGCKKGLVEAIRRMDKEGAKALMIILTCVPEVIGEDVEGIIHEIQPDVTARLSFVQMGHFKCNSHPSGFWKTLVSFEGLMENAKARPDVINILGRSPDEEHIPMPALLKALEEIGFTLRMLAPKSAIEDFIKAPDARLSLVLSPYMNPLAETMAKKRGVPYISLHETYETGAVDALYASIEAALGITFGDAFTPQREKALSLEKKAADTLRDLTYVTIQRNTLPPLPLALYLHALGMTPLLLHVEEFYPDDQKWAAKLIEKGINPPICHMVNDKADVEVLEALAPALCFGELFEGRRIIPCVSYMYEMYGQAGYERTALLVERMLTAIQNPHAGDQRRD